MKQLLMLSIKNIRSSFIYLAILVLLLGYVSSIGLSGGTHVSAASLSNFNPGRIMDDSVMNNYNAMDVSAIQSFLNSKVPSCDTQGTQPASEFGYPNMTHAQYAAMVGWPGPPYTCLKDYNENGLSSAQIIYNVSQRYHVNPQVLIVLLQKESGLVEDTWPLPSEYKTATGYGCPDTSSGAACQSQYYGLTNQLTWSGHMFNSIMNDDPNWYSPYILGSNSIQYKPYTNCGSVNVNIVNHATQSLYDYTPYVPNAAALAAGYGTGDSCSSYGNRNFYLYFNDWFGSTIVANLPGCDEATNTTRTCIWSMYNPANSDPYMTSSVQTRDELFTNQGYQYVGKAFFGNAVALAGNIPVYRASVSGGGSFLTTSQAEYNSLVSGGYVGNGIDFYADPSWSNTGYPVYRLYNPTTYQHVWTTDSQQRQTDLQNGYNDEGIAFTSISTVRQEVTPAQGKLLVYRFYIPQTYSHFWTTDVNERDNMINSGYAYEGVAWDSSSNSSNLPVYRLYAPSINQHLYTTDLSEKNNLVASGGWAYEGVSQYVSTTTTSQPVYRLYAPSLGVHLYTADGNERNQLLGSGHWNNEGIAWYQP